MISIVVSSCNDSLFKKLQQNIKETIGEIQYEVIRVYNPGIMSICEAYNKGGELAKYKYLVFSHEDVTIHTKTWGQLLINTFSVDNKIGLIGIIGAKYKSYVFGGGELLSSNMIHNSDSKCFYNKIYNGKSHIADLNKIDINELPQSDEILYEQVAVLDGMFLATKKSIFNKIKFDAKLLNGFHAYDMDYSLQISLVYKVVVSHNILLEHSSNGNYNREWFAEFQKFQKKWSKVLPYCSVPLDKSQKSLLEFKSFESFIAKTKGSYRCQLSIMLHLVKPKFVGILSIKYWLLFHGRLTKKFLWKFRKMIS